MLKQTVTVYRVWPNKQWRWRLKAANRVIIGASSESFVRLSRCLENLHMVTGIQIVPDDYEKKISDKSRFLVEFDQFKSGRRIPSIGPVML